MPSFLGSLISQLVVEMGKEDVISNSVYFYFYLAHDAAKNDLFLSYVDVI